MFTGLSAFPLTPISDDEVDLAAYSHLVSRLTEAKVASIGALGSTGSYAYLDRAERRAVAAATVEHADGIPVTVGVGAMRTSQVQALAEDAQNVGASAVLLAPVSYQRLTDDDVYHLYADVAEGLSVPLVVYDNPSTTHFTFSLDLYSRIADLPHVAAIKIPPIGDVAASKARVDAVRAVVPPHIKIGISGDPAAAAGLLGGCDLWFSGLAGVLPGPMQSITDAALAGSIEALTGSARLQPLWDLFTMHGGTRVIAATAEYFGLVSAPCLPRPILGLNADERATLARVIDGLGL